MSRYITIDLSHRAPAIVPAIAPVIVSVRVLACLCGLSLWFYTTAISAQQSVQVRTEDGLVWIQANNAPASELANEISQTLGINVIIAGDTETRINLDIVEEPLDKAMEKISPSNMLVRNGNSSDSDIVEIILMMGEGTGSAGLSNQFLPSGSPAEPVISQEQQTQIQEAADPEALRERDRARIVREAAAAASNDANLPPVQVPPMFAEDQSSIEPVIDPETGLPIDNQ